MLHRLIVWSTNCSSAAHAGIVLDRASADPVERAGLLDDVPCLLTVAPSCSVP